MPRKAKEKIEELNNIENEKKVKKSIIKKATKVDVDKSDISKNTKSPKKDKMNTLEKSDAKTSKVKTTTKSKTTSKTKSSTSSKAVKTTAKSKSTNVSSKSKNNLTQVIPAATEYYDLPFRYNETVVKILAQTPNTLFIYWDISDEDRNLYIEKYGKDFFENTRPYLFITNTTMNYTFEVEINDFANSWYLHINDANCEYKVELRRKFIVNSSNVFSDNSFENTSTKFGSYQANDYLYITSSNSLEMPNDKILFDKLGSTVFFRNTKTSILERKDISSISFLQKIGKVYNIYDLYKEIYQDELVSDEFGLNLPSSSSSSFKL